MRILLDENVPGPAVDALRRAGHDVEWVRVSMPGSSDAQVLEQAGTQRRLLVTFDKDFGDLVYHAGLRASRGIVLFRLSLPSPAAVAEEVARTLGSRDDWGGHFSVVEIGRVRMVSLPETDR